MLAEAPLFQQAMPKTGAPLSVKMSNAGAFGWVTDREDGYRYQALHPQTGKLGDDATFLIGGMNRKDPVRRLRLRSGDVVWFGGPARLIYHGVQGIVPGSSPLLPDGGFTESGRLNLTLRRIDLLADKPD